MLACPCVFAQFAADSDLYNYIQTNGAFQVNLWFGNVATGDVIQIHPHLSNWWQVTNNFEMEHAHCLLELSYDNNGARISQVPRSDTGEEFHCNRTQDIPLTILVMSARSLIPLTPDYWTREGETNVFGHWWQPVETNSTDGVIEWVSDHNATMLHPCPALHVSVQAPVCGTHTRTHFEVQRTLESEWEPLRHITSGDLPERNCSVPSPSLHPRVFLTPMQNYSFSLHLYPDTGTYIASTHSQYTEHGKVLCFCMSSECLHCAFYCRIQ